MIIFCDSWDHYSIINTKWTSQDGNTQIDLTGTKSRTGIGCMLCTGAAGAQLIVDDSQKLLCGTAYYSDSASDQNVIWFSDILGNAFSQTPVRLWVLANGAIRVTTGNDPFTVTVCQSVAGLYHFQEYNYLEVKAFLDSGGPNGTVEAHCNGRLATSATGVTFATVLGFEAFGKVKVLCAGGLPDCRHDDTYIIDWTDPAGDNIDFLGPVQIYAGVPVADVSVTWTPSTGVSNFAMVDEIPPNGDTDYNSTAVVGSTDQYQHPLTAVPANSTIFAVQHCQALRVTTGALELTSVVYGVENTASEAIASGVTYLIFRWPMDVNPDTGIAWDIADFPVNAGPKLVA